MDTLTYPQQPIANPSQQSHTRRYICTLQLTLPCHSGNYHTMPDNLILSIVLNIRFVRQVFLLHARLHGVRPDGRRLFCCFLDCRCTTVSFCESPTVQVRWHPQLTLVTNIPQRLVNLSAKAFLSLFLFRCLLRGRAQLFWLLNTKVGQIRCKSLLLLAYGENIEISLCMTFATFSCDSTKRLIFTKLRIYFSKGTARVSDDFEFGSTSNFERNKDFY